MTSRTNLVPSLGVYLALAVVAVAVIYYGAVPWALGKAIGATLWLFGYR
jgi:hypothetical protein